MRPPGPEPATVVRSMPASLARRRLAGEVMTRPWRVTVAAAGAAVGAADFTTDAGAAGLWAGSGACAVVLAADAVDDAGGAAATAAGTAPSLNSNTISGE